MTYTFGDTRLPKRFWDKVQIDPDTCCWEWTAYRNSEGYGRFSYQGQPVRAHRLAYELLAGDATGLHCDHLCRNRSCVNPRHIEAVTAQVNVRRGLRSALATPIARCKYGHDFNAENTYIDIRGHRQCRSCASRRRSEVKARQVAGVQGPANGARTSCKRGHEFSDENTYRTPDGRRQCRTCRREAAIRHTPTAVRRGYATRDDISTPRKRDTA